VDKAIAGALAGTRICALRYDKRGVGAVLLADGSRPAEEILSWQTEMVAARLPIAARLILKIITRADIIRSQRKRVARIKASTCDVIQIQGLRINARWWRDFLAYDPRPALARITVRR
jgi:uncharacterized protein